MDKQECIERQLESALLEGRWGVFERLPSERGLAEAFGVNRATVRAALRALNRQALILPARHGAVAFAELDAFYADWADRRARRCRRTGQPCRVSAKP